MKETSAEEGRPDMDTTEGHNKADETCPLISSSHGRRKRHDVASEKIRRDLEGIMKARLSGS